MAAGAVWNMDDAAKRLKSEWKLQQQDAARRGFPLDADELVALFAYVGARLAEGSCDHTLAHALDWLGNRGGDAEPVVTWLHEHGGYCDCEVVANVEDHFESNRL